jgi:curved DNA-binding protein CbpA
MTASTADYYGILGLTSDATLAEVKKAYRKLARQHHPDRNNADPRAIDRFRRITEAYEYLSAHLKDNANGNGHIRPGPTAPPRADAGVPGEHSEAASPVLTILEETWQAIRARHAEIPPVVIIIASGATGRDARWDSFDSQQWTVHTTGTRTKILLIQTTAVTHIRGWYGVRRPAHSRRRSVASTTPWSPARRSFGQPPASGSRPHGVGEHDYGLGVGG